MIATLQDSKWFRSKAPKTQQSCCRLYKSTVKSLQEPSSKVLNKLKFSIMNQPWRWPQGQEHNSGKSISSGKFCVALMKLYA